MSISPELYEATANNDLATVQNFLSSSLTLQDFNELFALACEKGHLEQVQHLYQTNSEIQIAANAGKAFLKTCENGHIRILQFLISLRQEKSFVLFDLNYAFLLACQNGHLAIVQYLIILKQASLINLDIHADLEDKFYGRREKALQAAILNNRLEIVKFFKMISLEEGKNNYGKIKKKYLLEFELEFFYDFPDDILPRKVFRDEYKNDMSLLKAYLVNNFYSEEEGKLLKLKEKIDNSEEASSSEQNKISDDEKISEISKNKEIESILSYGRLYQFFLTYDQFFLKFINVRLWKYLLTHDYIEMANYLLDVYPKFLFNPQSLYNIKKLSDSALAAVCKAGKIKAFHYLLDKFSPEAFDIHYQEEKAFRNACEFGHLPIVQELLALSETLHQKIDIFAKNNYAFQYALINGHLEIFKILLELDSEEKFNLKDLLRQEIHEVDLGDNYPHKNMLNSFIKLCENGHFSTLEYLMIKCAEKKIEISMRLKLRGLFHAGEYGREEIFKYLLNIILTEGDLDRLLEGNDGEGLDKLLKGNNREGLDKLKENNEDNTEKNNEEDEEISYKNEYWIFKPLRENYKDTEINLDDYKANIWNDLFIILIENDHLDLLKYYLEKIENFEKAKNKLEYALGFYKALKHNNFEMMQFLLEKNKMLNIYEYDYRSFKRVCKHRKTKLFKFLLKLVKEEKKEEQKIHFQKIFHQIGYYDWIEIVDFVKEEFPEYQIELEIKINKYDETEIIKSYSINGERFEYNEYDKDYD